MNFKNAFTKNLIKTFAALLVCISILGGYCNLSVTEASASNQVTSSVKSKVKAEKAKAKKIKKGAMEDYSASELRYMASIIYCEAGNQCYAGKLAVGIVVKNRMESNLFPNSIKGVLYQSYQFTPARNGMLSSALSSYDKTGFKNDKAHKECLKAAKAALSGQKKVTYNKKTYNMDDYLFFSRYVSGCRLKIQAHMFK